MFSISNASLVSELNEAQTILNGYLNNSNILSGQSVSYYASYQTQLESALSNIGVANQPPSVSYIATPSGTQSGNVTISYGLADANSDTCSIAVQYSPDGAHWYTATQGSGGNPTSGLASSVGGTSYTYAWNSSANLGNTNNSDVEISITPTDTETGG